MATSAKYRPFRIVVVLDKPNRSLKCQSGQGRVESGGDYAVGGLVQAEKDFGEEKSLIRQQIRGGIGRRVMHRQIARQFDHFPLTPSPEVLT
jgi:hypothetical protein